MDASDELRAALQQRQAKEDARAREGEEREQQREAYEREEDDMRQQLYEIADLTVQTLAKTEPEEALIEPKPQGLGGLLRTQKHAAGWRIRLDGSERVLCPDGTLIRPGSHRSYESGIWPAQFSTLHAWIDERLKGARTEGGDSNKDYFREAFAQGVEGSRQELQRRLAKVRASITQLFADLLHERKLSL